MKPCKDCGESFCHLSECPALEEQSGDGVLDFDEYDSDFGGAFDGVGTVYSDADGGL